MAKTSKIRTISGTIEKVHPNKLDEHKLCGHEADIAELLKKGIAKGTIARIFGVSRPDLYYFMQTRQISFKNKDKLTWREQEITEMFHSCVSIQDMARFFHVGPQRMKRKIEELGLERDLSDVLCKSHKNKTPNKRHDQIRELFDKGISPAEIAKALDIGCSTVYSVIAKLGLKLKASTPRRAEVELVDKRDVIVKMHNIGISTKDIASVFECDPQVIRYRLRAKGIKMASNGRTITA